MAHVARGAWPTPAPRSLDPPLTLSSGNIINFEIILKMRYVIRTITQWCRCMRYLIIYLWFAVRRHVGRLCFEELFCRCLIIQIIVIVFK